MYQDYQRNQSYQDNQGYQRNQTYQDNQGYQRNQRNQNYQDNRNYQDNQGYQRNQTYQDNQNYQDNRNYQDNQGYQRNQSYQDNQNYQDNRNYQDNQNYQRNQNYQDNQNYQRNQSYQYQSSGPNLFNRNEGINQSMNSPAETTTSQRKGKLEYLTSTLTANIYEYTERHVDKNQVIFYRIKVTDHFNSHSWVVEKRYNDFENLRKQIVKNFPDIPKLPGKTIFRVSDFAAIKKRKDGLQQFLKALISRKDVFASEEMKNFLELESNSPDLCGNSPDMKGNIDTFFQGVRSFQFIPNENIIAICTAEMSVLEKAESKIYDLTNVIGKQEEITNPQGMVYVYTYQKLNNQFLFNETWRRKFRCRTSSIYYDQPSQNLFIGRVDGYISIHRLDPNSDYTKTNNILELKNHLSSVKAIWFDNMNGKIYSVSADKRFVTSEMNYNAQITEINRINFEYTSLFADVKYGRLFTSAENGLVEIYSLKRFPPNKLCSITISGQSNIRDIYVNISQSHIFACDNKGKISVLDFGSSNNSITEISQFGCKGKESLRVIEYDENKKELITGAESGKIVIWSLKTGQPIFSWVAHNGAITKLYYDPYSRILISGAKDKSIKVWKLPDNWVNQDVLKFENEELSKINSEIARRRIKAQQEIEDGIENDFDSDLSQEDDLNGWNYRKDK